MNLKVKGRPIEIMKTLLLAKIERIRYSHIKTALKRIERVKNQFKYALR
jgi:hypothetical protein